MEINQFFFFVYLGPLYVIVEYATFGNLRDFLRSRRPDSVEFDDSKQLFPSDFLLFALQVCF